MPIAEELPLTVETWSDDGSQIVETLARVRNHDIARAAFDAATRVRPRSYVVLCDRARIVAKRAPPSDVR